MALAQAKHVQVLPDIPLPIGSFHAEVGEGTPSLLTWSQGFGEVVAYVAFYKSYSSPWLWPRFGETKSPLDRGC